MCEVSIIIPTYNRAHLIDETIQSFINQTYSNWEIIVVDDGATDNTPDLIKSYKDTRINYRKRNKRHKKGPSGCRNYGLSLAKGKFVLFFDDDDIAHPDLINLCIKEFSEKEIDFCRYLRDVFYNDFDIDFNRNHQFDSFKITSRDLESMITNRLPFNTCAVVWKKTCFGKERFNEDLFYADEWEFYQRILSNEIEGISLNKVLIFARKHAVSSTNNFLTLNPKYLNSTRNAMKLVIQNLYRKGKLSPSLTQFFLRSSLALEDRNILEYFLEKVNANIISRMKYKLGYRIYPVLKPIFKLKSKIFKP